jgi:hypothetical protein
MVNQQLRQYGSVSFHSISTVSILVTITTVAILVNARVPDVIDNFWQAILNNGVGVDDAMEQMFVMQLPRQFKLT